MVIVERLTLLLSAPGSSHALTSANSPGGAACVGLKTLALALLVLGVLADDANDTATVNHLALVADRLY